MCHHIPMTVGVMWETLVTNVISTPIKYEAKDVKNKNQGPRGGKPPELVL